MKKLEMLNNMHKKTVIETALVLGIIIFVFALILLTIQSVTGHKSLLLSLLISLLIMILIFMLIEKTSKIKKWKKTHLE